MEMRPGGRGGGGACGNALPAFRSKKTKKKPSPNRPTPRYMINKGAMDTAFPVVLSTEKSAPMNRTGEMSS